MTHTDVYEQITGRIIDQLTNGVVAWRKPWTVGSARNLISGKAYQGINALLLSTAPYQSRYWLSFKQARERGGSVRKGERGMPIVFWDIKQRGLFDGTDLDDDKPQTYALLRYWTVFNVEQCDGVDYPSNTDVPTLPLDAAAQVVDTMPMRPTIAHHNHDRASYNPSTDAVTLPPLDAFRPPEAYYCTLFHELAHSTGHASRLGRPGIVDFDRFGSQQYSVEELIAEMTAAMLCGVTGISPAVIENEAAYLASWLKALKADHRMIIVAAGQAQKASDFILGTLDTSADTAADVA